MKPLQKSCTRILPPKSDRGRALLLGALLLLLAAAALLSLCLGSQRISLAEAFSEENGVARRILLHVRIPRTLAAAAAGGALAVAGALIQGVLNNAMASPNIIGVNAGAGFFAMACVTMFPAAGRLMPLASFLGALCTALAIYLMALRAGLSRTTLILAGVAVNSVLTAGVDALTLLYPDDVIGATGFMLGGFSGVMLDDVAAAGAYLAVGAALALWLAPDLDVLQLGEESAAGLGLHVSRVRFLAILAAALLAGGAVSFSGLLGFVGLLVPHMARRLVGRENRWLVPACALLGAAFVLGCDVLARVLFSPFELPVGVVMSLLGGPFFLAMLLRRKRGRVYD